MEGNMMGNIRRTAGKSILSAELILAMIRNPAEHPKTIMVWSASGAVKVTIEKVQPPKSPDIMIIDECHWQGEKI